MELQLKGNLFYRRFLDLSAADPVPDHSTICRFRKDLYSMELYKECFQELNRQLSEKGYELKTGKIVDARIVKAARNSGKDDPDADFTKKKKQSFYGYKDHIAIDVKNEFVSEFVCTPANVHDSQVVDELLEGDEVSVFADKTYYKQELRRRCRRKGIFCEVLAKARRNRPLSARQKKRKRDKQKG